MVETVSLDEAQSNLRRLITEMAPGDELRITDCDRVIARVLPESATQFQRPGPGLAKGIIAIVDDDDEHLKDFAEYMP